MNRLQLVVAAIGVLAVPSPAAAAPPPDAWGQAAAHATGDWFNPGETRLTPATVGRLRASWTVPLAAAKCADPATPLVAANRLVTAASYRISGHDATTGKLTWQTPATTRRTSISLAAIVGTRLVAQSRDCRSGKTSLTALDVTTGQVLYTRPIPEPMYGLVVDNGIVAGGVWDTAISKYGVRAYRIADGSRAWARVGSIGGETIAAAGRVLVAGDDSTSAVDLATGKTLWSPGAGCWTPIGASPDGGAFYMRCDPDGPISRVDAATGRVLATFPSPGSTSGFATDGERVYLHTFANQLIAIDARTGRRVWTAGFAEEAPIEVSIGGGVVYGWRDSGRAVVGLSARTGKTLPLDARISTLRGAPIVANGRLYGRTASGVAVYAIR
ncbi:PQQ-binding-like beta-propeller repeat protein [Actinoplanes bogorensis]|uniref:PQQ-binding-like beta-propeller repeat protein n=1 Tax=Paractinoplanes bogorensis TaxID=1610840 RepID=A0ABS5YXJ3_9ACTN|nr:PQQ-binding-like beta-propeller repeat protein [Actinoplanes bogorensis]MBU2668056.1 PQQ-binding-like beta-propeller repeat protein [Actinoplanes bogorensis]